MSSPVAGGTLRRTLGLASVPHTAISPSAAVSPAALRPAAALHESLSPHQTLVIYDGACGICQDFARLARRMDRADRLALLPQQTPGLLALVGLSEAEAERAAWAVLPDGRLLEGAAAMAAVLDACAAWPWPLCRALQTLPLLRPASRLAYRLLATHRHHLGRGSCDRPMRAPELSPAQRWELARRGERAAWEAGRG